MTLELRLQLESLTVSDRTRVFGESLFVEIPVNLKANFFKSFQRAL